MKKYARFGAADYRTDEETIDEYLSAGLEDPNPDMLLVVRRGDLDGTLAAFFKPGLAPKELAIAQIEGWILGIK